ncbi:unnamed protein product [Didymodactylos carnosus]|uniref:Uncharacterized protein n=2 Tax=Didymodactylos carnosus TaxID=1234261 RepID=A0A8S2GTA3_9BILA|nr:unnamed protein product [Didymodactylos carnosus]CAF3537192.1 unnamed protein product [Didymodactylos carnosus]
MIASSELLPNEEDVKEVLHGAHNKFLNEVEKDISRSKFIEKKWQKAYIGNCRRLRDEMYEYQFEFIQGTLAKVNSALLLSETEKDAAKRTDLFLAFQMIFDDIAVRCTHVDNQLKIILKAVADQDPDFSKKYICFMGVSIGTAVVAGAIGAVLLSTGICGVSVAAIPVLIVAAVALTAAAGFFLYRMWTTKTKLQTKAYVYNWAAQCFPTFGKLGPHDNCSDKELEDKFHKILCTMRADEDVWKSNIKLETLKSSLKANFLRLEIEKSRVEKEDRALSGKK